MLTENGIEGEAFNLVKSSIFSIEDLARKLYVKPDHPENSNDSLSVIADKLGTKLEFLGFLISEDGDTSAAWVKNLCFKCPSKKRLQRIEFSDLDDILRECPNAERKLVEGLYMEGQPIRKQVHRYGLGLDIAQDLEKRGVTEADNLREDVIEDIVRKYPNAKRILNKMLRDAQMQKSEEKVNKKIIKSNLKKQKDGRRSQ